MLHQPDVGGRAQPRREELRVGLDAGRHHLLLERAQLVGRARARLELQLRRHHREGREAGAHAARARARQQRAQLAARAAEPQHRLQVRRRRLGRRRLERGLVQAKRARAVAVARREHRAELVRVGQPARQQPAEEAARRLALGRQRAAEQPLQLRRAHLAPRLLGALERRAEVVVDLDAARSQLGEHLVDAGLLALELQPAEQHVVALRVGRHARRLGAPHQLALLRARRAAAQHHAEVVRRRRAALHERVEEPQRARALALAAAEHVAQLRRAHPREHLLATLEGRRDVLVALDAPLGHLAQHAQHRLGPRLELELAEDRVVARGARHHPRRLRLLEQRALLADRRARAHHDRRVRRVSLAPPQHAVVDGARARALRLGALEQLGQVGAARHMGGLLMHEAHRLHLGAVVVVVLLLLRRGGGDGLDTRRRGGDGLDALHDRVGLGWIHPPQQRGQRLKVTSRERVLEGRRQRGQHLRLRLIAGLGREQPARQRWP